MEYQVLNEQIEIDCGQVLDRATVLDQRELLIKTLELKKPIIFMSDKIERIDTASLQLLLSFVKKATHENIMITWETPSNTFVEAATLLGLRELLKLPGR